MEYVLLYLVGAATYAIGVYYRGGYRMMHLVAFLMGMATVLLFFALNERIKQQARSAQRLPPLRNQSTNRGFGW